MSVQVELERQGSGTTVALVTLDDPARRNVLSPELLAELVPALAELDADPLLGAVVITGAPPAFCSGALLGSLADAPGGVADMSESGGRDVLLAIYAGFEAVERLGVPTIAAVNGPAVGAGMNLAMACDIRIAASAARFDTRFLALGLHPGGGHTWSLVRLVGPQAARAMLLFGEVVGGEDAVALGLAWKCVADADLLDASLELARRAAALPPGLARRTKQTLQSVPELGSKSEATAVELEAQLWSVEQPDFRERLASATPPRNRLS